MEKLESNKIWQKFLIKNKIKSKSQKANLIRICKNYGIEKIPVFTNNESQSFISKIKFEVMSGLEIDRDYIESMIVSHFKVVDYVTKDSTIVFYRSKKFLSSQTWKNIRFKVLSISNKCQLCGASPDDGAVLSVDHIKPRSIYPELAVDIKNLQVLCMDCNSGKGNMYIKDFR